MVTGIMTATSGVLLVKAELAAMKSPTPLRTNTLFCAARRETMRVKLLISPVRTSPPETMNMAAMVQGAGFEKASNTPSAGTIPSSTRIAAPSIAVTSTGKISSRKITSMPARTISVTMAGVFPCDRNPINVRTLYSGSAVAMAIGTPVSRSRRDHGASPDASQALSMVALRGWTSATPASIRPSAAQTQPP